MPPVTGWTFAELTESSDVPPELFGSSHDDTGHVFHAFLPLQDGAQRTSLRRLRGPASVMDLRVVCAGPQLVNVRLDTTLPSAVKLSGQILAQNLTYNSYPTTPYIDFGCRLPSLVYEENNTVGKTSLCVPSDGQKLPSLISDHWHGGMAMFMVLDVVSSAAVIGTGYLGDTSGGVILAHTRI